MLPKLTIYVEVVMTGALCRLFEKHETNAAGTLIEVSHSQRLGKLPFKQEKIL